jgi:hypothetical protein
VDRDPAALAADIGAARDRLIAFVGKCDDGDWLAAPIESDPRPVGIIVDHVAHSYEYLSGWIRQVLAGEAVAVTAEMVDGLKAEHAAAVAGISQAEVTEHLRTSGAAICALITGLSTDELDTQDGQIRSFAEVAIRHPDSHRTEIEAALDSRGCPC